MSTQHQKSLLNHYKDVVSSIYYNFSYFYKNYKLKSLDSPAFLTHGKQYDSLMNLINGLKRYKWHTYCSNFLPLLVEVGKYNNQTIDHLTTDNNWGCTIRCMQMLVHSCLPLPDDQSDALFRNNKRF